MVRHRTPGQWPSIRGFFPYKMEEEFAAYQRANPRFALHRLDRNEAMRIIYFLKHPDHAAMTDEDQEAKDAAEERYALIGNELYLKTRTGARSLGGSRLVTGNAHQQRRVVYNPNEVFQICADAHLRLLHGKDVATARRISTQFVGVHFDEVAWVVEHCLHCAKKEQAKRTRAARQREAARQLLAAGGGKASSATAMQQLGAQALDNLAGPVQRYTSPSNVRVLVMVVDMGPMSVTGGRHALFIQDIDTRVAVLYSLPSSVERGAVAQAIVFWATLRGGAPQYIRFGLDGDDDADGLARDTLHLLRERHALECRRDTFRLPPGLPPLPTEYALRVAIMAWLQRNGPAAWDVVLRGVTIELNDAMHPGAATARACAGTYSGSVASVASSELMTGMRAMEIGGGNGGDGGEGGQEMSGEGVGG